MSNTLAIHRRSRLMSAPQDLQVIANIISLSKRIVVIVGAGISTSAGIPDFRSSEGIYLGGQIFENAAFFDARRPQLLRTALHLRDLAASCNPTDTHLWLATLSPKLLRCYTQNVDLLEEKAGLATGVGRQFDCIPLHGSLSDLKCHLCHNSYDWDNYRHQIENYESHSDGCDEDRLDLACPGCNKRQQFRQEHGLRSLSAGQLRPGMIMLDEVHPEGEEIASVAQRDCSSDPDLVLVMGTSLKVYGPKALFRQFARRARKTGGTIIYVNQTKPPSDCKAFIDHWVSWEVDKWVRDLKERNVSLGTLAKKRRRKYDRQPACYTS